MWPRKRLAIIVRKVGCVLGHYGNKNHFLNIFFLDTRARTLSWRYQQRRSIKKRMGFIDRSLIEAVQGIALSEDLPCTVYLNFTVFRHVSIQNFQTSLNMFEEQYQITSEFLYHLLNFSVFRHVLTYLRIVSIRIIFIDSEQE